jgi:hypothetical protein
VQLAFARQDAEEQKLFLGSMKLAPARQGDKEPGLRDDVPALSRAATTDRADIGASNSPILGSKGLGPAYRSLMTFGQADDLVYEFATYCITTLGRPA